MIKAIDFFCGAGGLTRGLLDAGISVLAGVDNDMELCKTYEANNHPSQFVCADIARIDIARLRNFLGITDSDVVLYAACTPCQPFSTLNRLKTSDERRSLLTAFGKIARLAPPDYILVENVPGLTGMLGERIYNQFMKVLRSCGFEHSYSDLLDAKEFGVPQTRKRFILISSKRKPIVAPKRSKRVHTVRDAIRKYPRIIHGETGTRAHHVSRRLQPNHRAIISLVPIDGGSRSDIKSSKVLLKCHRGHPGHKDVFGRMAWDQPAPTLTCRCTDVYCGRFVHPSQNRGISLREAAALQTFDDAYEFMGSFSQIARMIGNAVPVKLAKKLGSAILKTHQQ